MSLLSKRKVVSLFYAHASSSLAASNIIYLVDSNLWLEIYSVLRYNSDIANHIFSMGVKNLVDE